MEREEECEEWSPRKVREYRMAGDRERERGRSRRGREGAEKKGGERNAR